MRNSAEEHIPAEGAGRTGAAGDRTSRGEAAVSPGEEALWLLESMVPDTPVNNLSAAFAVDGRVDATRLRAALAVLVRRHEALRTVYRSEGARLVKWVADAGDLTIPVREAQLSGEPSQADLAPVAAAPFALDGGPMVRVGLFRSPGTECASGTEGSSGEASGTHGSSGAASDTHGSSVGASGTDRSSGGASTTDRSSGGSAGSDLVCVTAHHLVLDEVSGPLLLAELALAYEQEGRDEGERATAAAPGADREPVPGRSGPVASAGSLAFWRAELAGVSTGDLELSCTAPEPDRPTLAADRLDRTLPPRTTEALQRCARDMGVPESAVLLAAYYVLLETHGAGPDLLVGFPVDRRPQYAAGAIGRHTSHVPLRLRTDRKESIRDLVLRSAERLTAGTAHADVAVDAHPALMPAGGSARRSLPFRHAFEYRTPGGPPTFSLGGLDATPFDTTSGAARFDLQLTAIQGRGTDGAVALRLCYRTELFDAAQAELLLARYEAVLASFLADPDRAVGDVRWWSGRDHEIIGAANDTAGPVDPATVLAAVEQQVRRTPAAVAVVDGEHAVSYRQLWNAAHAMGACVREAGLGPGDVVAIALPRGAELVAAVLGTWLGGAAYMPLDAAHPEDRLRYQLSDSGAKVLVANEETAAIGGQDGPAVLLAPPVCEAPPQPAADAPAAPVDPAACAYLMYTSGSTGRPKGTLVGHAALVNLAVHFVAQLAASPGDTMLWTTTFAFDISGLELFVPLISGGRVVAAPDPARSDGRVLRALLDRYDARFVQATPTTWRLVIDRAAECLRGRSVLVGGEPVPLALARQLLAAGCELHHVYGPTETTIWSTSRVIAEDPGARLDVGRPILNTRTHVVDSYGRDLPVGVRGELCISGTGVALGYHGRPELDAERFGIHPEHGRFYRTGDVACWRTDGLIDLFGRSDRQVKLRGNRIELGEIEATLLTHPQVGAAAVILVGDPSGDGVLIGCLAPADGTVDTASVREYARARLSRSMLPGDLVTVDSLPVNGSGKVDHRELERIVTARRTSRAAEDPSGPGGRNAPGLPGDGPPDTLTAQLVTVWRNILRREDADADTDFFAGGGNSMLAAVALQEFQNISGHSLSLSEVFERPTPRELSARVREAEQEAEAGTAAG
ncbi:amino acid adenylation domain-containing protein [Streptomyces sp. NPDC059398]|uniref:non-ribosomal peptide synthetase n=1 Tax=Streptomyces sp. NPDC059398 TaxID=3346820 RepID=UPI0036C4108A